MIRLFHREKRKQKLKRQNRKEETAVYTRSQKYMEMEPTVSILPSSQSSLSVGISSIIGARRYQQDAADFVVNRSGGTMAVVCDGMGGMEDGGIASNLCVEEICRAYEVYGELDYPAFFCREIHRLDQKIVNLKDAEGKQIKTGTTFAGVIITGNEMYWCSVGDSRIYLIRGNEIAQATRDHNYSLILKEKIETHQMTPERARQQSKKEALISFIGLGRMERIDVNQQPFYLEEGDYILLCSDGLYKSMDDDMILQTVKLYSDDMSDAAEILTASAACIGENRQDNTTVIIMKYKK